MKKSLHIILVVFLSLLTTVGFSQTCDCTDCPVDDEGMQLVTTVIDVSGLTNSTLNEGGQGICEITLDFSHDWISDLEIVLVAPNGSSISLLLDNTSGSITDNSTWDITFLPCADTPSPDPGAGDVFNGSDFDGDMNYTGSYHPGSGCFSDLTGSANGEWTLEFTSLIASELVEITTWSITFCDGDGLDCSAFTCEAELGDYDLTFSTFCEGDDPIILDPTITGGQTDGEYNTTFVLTTNVGGFPGEIIGYSEDADLTGFAAASYFACGINYFIDDESLLPEANIGNNYNDLEDLITDGTICGDLIENDCLLVFIDDCECEADVGPFSNITQTFCDTDDPIEAELPTPGENNSPEYTTTWVILENNTGSTGEILGYSETGDLTGFAADNYFICALNYLISDVGELPAPNAGNTNTAIFDLISDGTLCATFGFACAEVIIEDCSCEAEAGNINISTLLYCETDAIDLNPTINDANTDAAYDYTFTVSNYTSGSIGTLAGYTATGDLTGYAAGQYWVCGLSYLITDEALLPIADGSNSNLDIQDAIADGTICAELGAGCYVIDIQGEASIPILDFETEICVGEESSVTVTNFDPDATYGVQINSGSFSMLATGTPTTTFTPQTDLDIEICVVNFSICGDQQACANIVVNSSSAEDLMIEGFDNLCAGNFTNYTLTGLGNSTINGWTVTGDATIVGSNTDDNVDLQIDNVATTGSAELCVQVTDDCGNDIEECLTINIPLNDLTNATATNFCVLDFEISVLIDGGPGVGVWTVVSAPAGTVMFDDVNNATTNINVSDFGDYTLQFVFQCNQTIQINFTVADPLATENIVVECSGTFYTISFDIVGGELPYTVDGVAISGSSFTSDLINDDPYSFTIGDNSDCPDVILSGNPDCICDSDAGTINPQDLLISCEGETVTATSNGDDFLDADDIGIWILYSDIGDPLGSILLENTTGDFSFVAPLSYSTTYFIAYLVGNDIGGTVDLLDPCVSIADGTSIIFSEPFGLTGVTVDPLNSCGTEYELTAIQDSPIDGQWFFTIVPAGGSVSLSNINGTSTTATIEGEGLFTVQYSITDGLCSVTNNTIIAGPENPVATLLSTDCSADNSTYQVTINVDGGTAPYSVDGTSFSGSTFTSDDITSGDSYSFTFTDSNGCISEEFTGSFFCNCDSDAGNMSDELIEICGDGNTTSVNDGSEFLDGNDALIYILHTGAGNTLGIILDENQTGTFSFLPSMTYSDIYYVSAVVGNAMGSSIDLTDDCLNVAIGQSVIWYEEIIINSLTSDLEIGCENFNITLDASTSIEGVWSVISFPSGGSVTFDTNGNITNVVVDVIGVYTLQYEITNGPCSATEEITITLSEAPIISNVTYDCNDANENYQVSFDINGGIPPYIVNGTAVTGTTYTSAITPNGVSNDYAVTDVNGCISETITTNNDCSVDCISFAGTMPQDTIKTCYDTIGIQPIIQVSNDGNAILDGGDIGVYILHYDFDINFASPLATSTIGTFQDIGNVPYGVVLYVTYVVGNEINGTVDLFDPCLSVSVGQPIIFYQKPRVNLGSDRSVCGLISSQIFSINTGGGGISEWNIISTPTGGNITIDDSSMLNIEADTYGFYSISLTVSKEICSTTDTLNLEFIPLPTVNVMDDFSTCLSDIIITSTASDTSGIWSIPDLPEIVFDSLSDTTFIALDTFGLFDIIRTVTTDDCVASDTVTVEIFPPSEFIIIGFDCDATNENYTLTYEIIGDSYPYTINGEVINEGEIADLTATSESSINIVVLDSNLCEIYNNTITRSCDCESELSVNLQDLFRSCIQDTLFIIPAENFTLEEGDSLVYVFHNSPTDVITNIIAVSGDPFFVFDPLTMNTVLPYFVSVVIYSGGDFNLDSLDEPCAQTDLRRPVIWFGPSQTTIEDQTIAVCQGDDVIIPISHTGAVPIIVGIANTNGTDFQIEITEEGITEVSVPTNGSGFVTISYVVPLLFCDNTFSGVATVNVTPLPEVELVEDLSVCNDDQEGNTQVVLSDLITSANTDGTWTDQNGTVVIGTSFFNGTTPGDYIYTYTLTNACGSTSESIIVTVVDCLDIDCPTNVVLPLPDVCEGGSVVNLNDYVLAEFVDIGFWTIVEGGVEIVIEIPDVTIGAEVEGAVNFYYTLPGLSSDCDSIFNDSVIINEAPYAGESNAALLQYCEGTTSNLNLFDFIADNDLGGIWSSENTDLIDSELGILAIQNLTPGVYQLDYTVGSDSACPEDITSFNIEVLAAESVQLVATDPVCFGENDGSIIVLDSEENPFTAPYQIFDGEGQLLLNENMLPPGAYTFVGEGANGCEVLSGFVLNDPLEIFLDLGLDILIEEGETATISSNTNLAEANISLYAWFVNQTTIDAPSYENLILNPTNETIVLLSITDEDGCIVSDDILITLIVEEQPEVDVILPNIFNANNSNFGVEPFTKIERVESFLIYDRWGNNVFEAEGYDPEIDNRLWNGDYNGNKAMSGVYVYFMRYIDVNGEEQIIAGDVTLIR